MKRAAAIGGLVLLAGGVGATWYGIDRGMIGAPQSARATVTRAVPSAARATRDQPAIAGSEVVDATQDTAVDAGTTPMKQRVAVLGLLNKRNGVSRDLTLKPGQAVRVGDVVVRLSACEQTAPWEQQRLTGAFVQLDVQNVERRWQRVFSGWLYKERPQLNVVLHPIYDVWTKSCAMSFPGGEPAAAPSPTAKRSNAPKSVAVAAPDASAPDESDDAPSAAANNAI